MHPLLAMVASWVGLAASPELLPGWLDPKVIIPAVGLAGILVILFVECGLFCFFLPGDSLLFTAGLFATQTGYLFHAHLSLPVLLVACPVVAVAGAQTGHFLGVKFGRRLFERPNSRLLKRAHLERAEHYFEKLGPGRAVVLARFIPIIRTFLNPVAGVLGMTGRRFLLWNVVGGVLWTDGIVLLGYFLGKTIPGVDRYLLPAIALIVAVSVIPVIIELVKARKMHKANRRKATGTPQ